MVGVRTSSAEVFQLETFQDREEASKIEDETAEQLLEKDKGKKFVMTFLKLSPDKKFQLTSEEFKQKRLNKKPESFGKIFDKESYLKIDFRKVLLFDREKPKGMQIKADLYWFLEGHEGVQTFYFRLVKEKEKWVLDGIIY